MASQASSGVSGYSVGNAFFPFDREYYDQLSIGRPLLQVAGLDIFAGEALENHASKVDDTTLLEFAAKFYETALVLDVLRGAREQRTFRRALDIASGPGLQIRLLRLLGHVNSAEAIDIYDGSRRCGDSLLRSLARRLRLVFLAYRAQKLLPAAVRRLVPRLERLNRKFPLGVEEFGRHPDERPFGSRLRAGSSLSRYHVGDVFEVEGRYDLVTSFMGLEYFDFARLAAKVASLLAPHGLFCYIVSYWWYPVNNTLLYGRFPYLTQQLRTDEVLDYYRTVHPEVPLSGVARRLEYSDQGRPTIADYERIGYEQGLTPVASVRLHPNHHTNARAIVGPLAIDRRPPWNLERVLKGARRVNQSVGVADLMTSHVLMLFRRCDD